MEDGRWKMENGGWRMEDGGWRMEDGDEILRKKSRLFCIFENML
jgi:hypothetical protein